MKTSQVSYAQKAFILEHGDEGVGAAEICRKAGISQTTYFKIRWRAAAGDEAARGREWAIEEDRRESGCQ